MQHMISVTKLRQSLTYLPTGTGCIRQRIRPALGSVTPAQVDRNASSSPVRKLGRGSA